MIISYDWSDIICRLKSITKIYAKASSEKIENLMKRVFSKNRVFSLEKGTKIYVYMSANLIGNRKKKKKLSVISLSITIDIDMRYLMIAKTFMKFKRQIRDV